MNKRALAAGFFLATGCGLTITEPVPRYEDLPEASQLAVDRILLGMDDLNGSFNNNGGPDISSFVDVDNVQVHFDQLVMGANYGEGFIRVSVFDKLSAEQREIVAAWWGVSEEEAGDTYGRYFYDFVGTHLGAIQWIYDVQGVDRVNNDRPRFNLELDAQRLAACHYRDTNPAMLDTIDTMCQPLVAQYESSLGAHYDSSYFRAHLIDLLNPEDPTGYFWYLCKWHQESIESDSSMEEEMGLVKDRFGYSL